MADEGAHLFPEAQEAKPAAEPVPPEPARIDPCAAEAGFATTRVEIIGPKLGSECRTKVVQNVSIGQEMWLRVSAYDICARIFFGGHADRRP